jgi:hypothetical protein
MVRGEAERRRGGEAERRRGGEAERRRGGLRRQASGKERGGEAERRRGERRGYFLVRTTVYSVKPAGVSSTVALLWKRATGNPRASSTRSRSRWKKV